MPCEAERSSKDIGTRLADDKAPSPTCLDAVARINNSAGGVAVAQGPRVGPLDLA